ncbi:MAG: hypothetical protein HC890_06645 [Chloroflexaceae bacterium]|nr:hypothetical protein [Chloroflexaceae bacterium]
MSGSMPAPTGAIAVPNPNCLPCLERTLSRKMLDPFRKNLALQENL